MPAGGAATAGLATAGLGTIVGGAEAIWGAVEKKKYQKLVDALSGQRPQYQINQSESDIQNLAAARANQGMGAGSNQQLQNNTDRALATTTNAALMGGADANTIGGIVDKSQQGYNQNAIYNDQARIANLSNLQTAWARMSADRDKQWQLNQFNPWKDKMTALNQQLKGANDMMMNGLSMMGGSAGSAASKMGSGGGGGGGNTGGAPMSYSPMYPSSLQMEEGGYPQTMPGQ